MDPFGRASVGVSAIQHAPGAPGGQPASGAPGATNGGASATGNVAGMHTSGVTGGAGGVLDPNDFPSLAGASPAPNGNLAGAHALGPQTTSGIVLGAPQAHQIPAAISRTETMGAESARALPPTTEFADMYNMSAYGARRAKAVDAVTAQTASSEFSIQSEDFPALGALGGKQHDRLFGAHHLQPHVLQSQQARPMSIGLRQQPQQHTHPSQASGRAVHPASSMLGSMAQAPQPNGQARASSGAQSQQQQQQQQPSQQQILRYFSQNGGVVRGSTATHDANGARRTGTLPQLANGSLPGQYTTVGGAPGQAVAGARQQAHQPLALHHHSQTQTQAPVAPLGHAATQNMTAPQMLPPGSRPEGTQLSAAVGHVAPPAGHSLFDDDVASSLKGLSLENSAADVALMSSGAGPDAAKPQHPGTLAPGDTSTAAAGTGRPHQDATAADGSVRRATQAQSGTGVLEATSESIGGGGLPNGAPQEAKPGDKHATPSDPQSPSSIGHRGMTGLLCVLEPGADKSDLFLLSIGLDLTMLGLNMNSSEPLYTLFESPWDDGQATSSAGSPDTVQGASGDEPEFKLPECYYMQPPPLKTTHFTKFQLETLFYIFYNVPGDFLQLLAAVELNNREWRYHKDLKLWFTRAPGSMPGFERGAYIYFDISHWERRPFHDANLKFIQGLMTEDELRGTNIPTTS